MGLPTLLALMLFYSWRSAAILCIDIWFRVDEVHLVAELSIVLRLHLVPPELTHAVGLLYLSLATPAIITGLLDTVLIMA